MTVNADATARQQATSQVVGRKRPRHRFVPPEHSFFYYLASAASLAVLILILAIAAVVIVIPKVSGGEARVTSVASPASSPR